MQDDYIDYKEWKREFREWENKFLDGEVGLKEIPLKFRKYVVAKLEKG